MGMIEKIKAYLAHPEKVILNLMSKGCFDGWSDEQYLKLKYRLRMKKKLRLDDPVTFTEKLQWLKLHDRKPEYAQMVDKFEAKRYAAAHIGEKYIIPTLGVWDAFEDIDFDALPDQFVLKTTHDSGGVVICRDKASFDKKAARAKINQSLRRDYYKAGREWPYKNVKPRILAEQYLTDPSLNGIPGDLADYKVWNFNGTPVYIQYITGRNSGRCTEGFYSTDWMLHPFSFHNPPTDTEKEKPSCLAELLTLSATLAEGTAFMRTDFYVLQDGTIRFGEITFFPMGGMELFHPEEMDQVLGAMINLSCIK